MNIFESMKRMNREFAPVNSDPGQTLLGDSTATLVWRLYRDTHGATGVSAMLFKSRNIDKYKYIYICTPKNKYVYIYIHM